MKRFLASTLALALVVGSAGIASADPRGDHNDRGQQGDHNERGGYHDNGRGNSGHFDNGHHYGNRDHNWRRGQRMDHQDWDRGNRIDYREYHLSAPRRGYEWREVDGNYVLAAVATGVIFSIIANGH
jgi:Ni/Co efflux regulator RcnB